jgi:hypothetical protein
MCSQRPADEAGSTADGDDHGQPSSPAGTPHLGTHWRGARCRPANVGDLAGVTNRPACRPEDNDDLRPAPAELRSPRCLRHQIFLAAVTVSELRYGALVAGWGEARRNRLDESIQAATEPTIRLRPSLLTGGT